MPLFAELRRMMPRIPTTCTLPTIITLQATSESSVVTFGRQSGNNKVNLDCASVPALLSRNHAKIDFDPVSGVHTVTDLGSLNGTYLNGNILPTGPYPLQHGDIISFGGPANVSSHIERSRAERTLCFYYKSLYFSLLLISNSPYYHFLYFDATALSKRYCSRNISATLFIHSVLPTPTLPSK